MHFACSKSSTCVDGSQVNCPCAGGTPAFQICRNGEFEPCQCGNEDAFFDTHTDLSNPADADLDQIDPLTACTQGNATLQGNFNIQNSLDLAQIAGTTYVTGDLIISGNGLAAVSLPNLACIGGNLRVENTSGTTAIQLTNLVTVKGSLTIQNNASLTTISIAALVSTGADLSIRDNALLETVTFPSLISLKGDLVVSSNATLSKVELATITEFTGNNLAIEANGKLPLCSLKPLVDRVKQHGFVGTINLDGNLIATGDCLAPAEITISNRLDLVGKCKASQGEPYTNLELHISVQGTLSGIGRFPVPPSNFQPNQFSFDALCLKVDAEPCSLEEISNSTLTPKIETLSSNLDQKSKPLGLVILLDQSGSISGSIEPKDTRYIEVQDRITDGSLASDPQAVRIDAIKDLILNLGHEDKVLVVAFNSKDDLFTVCEKQLKQQFPNFEQQAVACYRTDKDSLTNPDKTVQTLQSTEIIFQAKGRTPLWKAVNWAIEFHKSNSTNLNAQILLVSDGADTCNAYEGFDDCPGTVSYETVRTKVQALTSPIPVHIVQFTSKVQTTPDPSQRELSCLSAGQYFFVNQVKGLKNNAASKGAISRLRDFLRGWITVTMTVNNSIGTGMGTAGLFLEGKLSVFGASADFKQDKSHWDYRLFVPAPSN